MTEKEALKKLRELTKINDNDVNHLLHQISTFAGQEKAGKLLEKIDSGGVQAKVAFVGSHTIQGLDNITRYEALKRNLHIQSLMGGYNQWNLLMLKPESDLEHFDPDVTVCSLDESIIYKHFGDSGWSTETLSFALEEAFEEIKKVLTIYTTRVATTIVLHTIPLPLYDWKAVTNYREKQKVSMLWRRFNQDLLNLHTTLENVIVLDFEVLTQDVQETRDPRMKHYASMSYTSNVWQVISKEIASIIASIKGLSQKVLALDLDQTLWGGIIGDDGVHGIQLSKTFPGNQFYAFQQVIKRLQAQGILLTIVSKNDWDNVKDVFISHDDMVLDEEDFVQISCNWGPKSESLANMASRLNLGKDSIVFVDDNPFERELVSSQLPEVTVIPLSQDPSLYIQDLLMEGYFNTMNSTDEDHKRLEKYKQIAKREELKEDSDSIEEYLLQLEMELDVFEILSSHVPRIAQLSQRTNQFNMTTTRLTESEVVGISNSESSSIYGFRLKDKFGDNGIVGYVHVKKEEHRWLIENFIMSCRVFQRSVECEVLRVILENAKLQGVSEVIGNYKPSKKNKLVSDFYQNNGFELVDYGENSTCWLYLFKKEIEKVEWIQLTASEEGMSV
ncbi:HAD family hydrolase [Anaerobacillus sp. 1_MG-2023]|uniref:HAD-IIIC family phosphatase n=1 Tax=Anaerobacillus sp. 1_MG-2023 TaxID=3062655 RepID=UPI0026E2B41F|nr:HAD family hydrolase [Anaerobacillus sp. 1_MG-2023]MDO6657355.1 HAD family hydrolase [Anaerobacillus sp. 1_MG-2023]